MFLAEGEALCKSTSVSFVVDSGCTQWMINDKSLLFSVYQLEEPQPIKLVNAMFNNGTHVVNMLLYGSGRNKLLLKDVLHCKDLRRNLFSFRKITDCLNVRVVFDNENMNVYLKDDLLLSGYKEGSFWKTDLDIGSEDDCFSAEGTDVDFEVFHRSLGHFGDHVHKYFKGPEADNKCEACVMGKQTQLP